MQREETKHDARINIIAHEEDQRERIRRRLC